MAKMVEREERNKDIEREGEFRGERNWNFKIKKRIRDIK